MRRETKTVSGIAMQTETSSPWKQEINRRVAEHKRRKFDAADAPPGTLVEARLAKGRIRAKVEGRSE